jgi:hypothetical protein
MGRIVVSDNVSLDGVIQDPAGDEGFERGGWVGPIKDRPELATLVLEEALRRTGSTARPAELRLVRQPLARSQWRAGGQVEHHAKVRRVLDTRRRALA